MVKLRKKRRYTATPSSVEVNVPAIPLLSPDSWSMWNLEDFPLAGTVPKNYLSYGDPRKPGTLGYIAKKGRTGNDARECVTEEIISRIGTMLPLTVAKSKLARVSRTDVRFLSQNFVRVGQQELLHGIELVALYFDTNADDVEDTFNLNDKQAEQKLYTVQNILTILQSLYSEAFDSLKREFFKMLAFDAFVGAPDRHAMNWGVLVPTDGDLKQVRFAPIFDTARGLFREISDCDLLRSEKHQGREQFLTKYARRSSPIISSGEEKNQNHFDLMRWIVENSDEQGREAVGSVFDAVDIDSIEHMLQRHFRRIFTQYRIKLIRDLLLLRIQWIRREILP